MRLKADPVFILWTKDSGFFDGRNKYTADDAEEYYVCGKAQLTKDAIRALARKQVNYQK
jgi:hypothetical protein